MQRVVLQRLIVRLIRLPHDLTRSDRKDRMAPAAIAAAIRHVGIEGEVVPAVGERREIVERSRAREQCLHRLGRDEREAARLDLLREGAGRGHDFRRSWCSRRSARSDSNPWATR